MANWLIPRAEADARGQQIEWLVLDVDGVLTDGRIYTSARGDELLAFHVHDGHGLRLWQRAGKQVAVISGRNSAAARARCADLGITHIYQNAPDKVAALTALLHTAQAGVAQVCYCGDELLDVPLLERVGLAVAVANAVPEALRAAQLVTTRPGGAGAVREVIEVVLQMQGRWHDVTARYFDQAMQGSLQ
ncbi:MAG: HAD hydrolase family protein [bacterium]|nr:HAD hydrolase family protein [bacterium]